MKAIRFCAVLLGCILGQASFGQGANKADGPTKDQVIPFQLTDYNNLSVQAILNDKDTVQLMFHTAANAVTLTEESMKKVKSLSFAGADTVKSWGGGNNVSRFSKSNVLKIGGLQWQNVPIWENKNSGPQTDGKFGIDLFAHKVIELDFDKNRMVIYSELPAKTKKYQKEKLLFENDMMFLEGNCLIGNSLVSNKFLIHSGYSGGILFDDTFAGNNKLDEKLTITAEKELKDSFGNVLKTKKAIVPKFMLGNEVLQEVPVGFFSGALGRQKMSVIGGDILKRFNVIIDSQREHIYLKANSLKNTSYTNT